MSTGASEGSTTAAVPARQRTATAPGRQRRHRRRGRRPTTWAVVAAVVLAAVGALAAGHRIPVAEAAAAGTTLRELAEARGVRFGSAVNANALDHDVGYADRLGAEFGGVTPEDAMKWAVVEPERGVFDWAPADAIVDFAGRHGQAVRGHTLVWYHSLPAWLTTGSFTIDELRELLRRHVEAEVGRYAGRVAAWDVVNEAFNADGTLRASIWLDRLGPGYIADAFRWAHAADPAAKLYLNDYDIEWTNPKSNALYALVRDLRAQGVPIDGVGFQAHLSGGARVTGLTGVLTRLAADLGQASVGLFRDSGNAVSWLSPRSSR